jgi:hypothetical protein
MSNELLQKVVDTVLVGSGGGGLLNTEQASRFIDYMWDATVLGQTTRRVQLNANERDIDKIGVGERIARHATEGVDDGINASPTFSKVTVRTEKIRLDWELTTESLEDGIEGGNLEDTVARLMATQLGNDIEDLAINGDTGIAPGDEGYALLKAFDGYRKLSLEGNNNTGGEAAHVISAGGGAITPQHFSALYEAIPRKFKARRSGLRYWTSSAIVQAYYRYLASVGTDLSGTYVQNSGPIGQPLDGPAGATPLRPYGIPLWEVPLQSDEWGPSGLDSFNTAGEYGYVELADAQNRIWAVKRAIQVYREFVPKKDAIEFTVFTRQGVQIENLDAYAVLVDVDPAATHAAA